MIILGLLIICWLYLFYRQALVPPNYTRIGKPYGSDLPFHIKFALGSGRHYSIYYYVLRWINLPFGGVNAVGCAIWLTAIMIVGYYVNRFYMKSFMDRPEMVDWSAVLLLFTAGIAVPVVFPFFYYGQLDTQPWHNGPYLLMRLFCFPVLLLYYRLKERKGELNASIKEYLLFALLCCVSCACKPSFLLALYPVILLELILDLIGDSSRDWKKQFMIGLSVVPSLGILLYQYVISFVQSGGTSGEGIVIGLETSLVETLVTVAMQLIFNLLFPLYVLWSENWKGLKKRPVRTALLLYLFAFLEVLLLHESGSRAGDGNFGWGMPAAAYVLMAHCICEFFAGFSEKEKWDKVMGIILMSAHFLTGIVYFILILLGEEAPGLL